MGDLKPWQIILIIAAVVAVGFTGWRFLTGTQIDEPDRLFAACVVTGELFDIRMGRARGLLLPAKHPETGERTLFPVTNDGGVWKVATGYLKAASPEHTPGSTIGASGEVEVTNSKPTVFTLAK